MKKSGKGFHCDLFATNGKTIATSEHYETRRAAMAGIESVRKNAADATFVDGDESSALDRVKRATKKPAAKKS